MHNLQSKIVRDTVIWKHLLPVFIYLSLYIKMLIIILGGTINLDKAANNVIIIWKRHYVEVLKGELNSTSTYVPAQLTKDQLLVHHINTLTKINVKIDKCELPTFYWLPKLHKRPYKEKKKEIWPSPMTKPSIPTENSKTKGQHTQTPPKTSITQRLRTDLGRSL